MMSGAIVRPHDVPMPRLPPPHLALCPLESRLNRPAIAALPDEEWQRASVGDGSKGPRVYDWAAIHLPFDAPEGWVQGGGWRDDP